MWIWVWGVSLPSFTIDETSDKDFLFLLGTSPIWAPEFFLLTLGWHDIFPLWIRFVALFLDECNFATGSSSSSSLLSSHQLHSRYPHIFLDAHERVFIPYWLGFNNLENFLILAHTNSPISPSSFSSKLSQLGTLRPFLPYPTKILIQTWIQHVLWLLVWVTPRYTEKVWVSHFSRDCDRWLVIAKLPYNLLWGVENDNFCSLR